MAVLTFFNDPWARIWSHGHIAGGPRKKRFVNSSISAVLGRPFPPTPGSVSELPRLWSVRSTSLLALRVHASLVSLLPNELNRVFKADCVWFLFLPWLPNIFHCGRSPSPMSLFKLLIKALVPITLTLETMSRPISLLQSLLRDQIWTHFIKAKCQS